MSEKTATKRYRIEYDRDGCIGAAACVAVKPESWSLAEDGKADLKDAKEVEEEKFVLEFDEDELEAHLEAAQGCPVNVIHIIDQKTGKRVI